MGNVNAMGGGEIQPGAVTQNVADLIETIEETRNTIPQDYTSLSNAVDMLPATVDAITGNKTGIWKSGFYTTSAVGGDVSHSSNSNYVCTAIPVTPGGKYTFNSTGSTGTHRQYAFADASWKSVYIPAQSTSGLKTGTVPSGAAYLVVNNLLTSQSSGYYAYVNPSINSRVTAVENDLIYLNEYAVFDHTMPTLGCMVKGTYKPNGEITTATNGISTVLFQVEKGAKILVTVTDNWLYSTWEGDSKTSLRQTHRLISDEELFASKKYIAFAFYKTEGGEAVNTQVSDYTGQITLKYAGETNILSDYIRDIPENAGTGNVIKRAYQATLAEYTPLADFPGFSSRTFYEDGIYQGIPYSSVRPENLYVPQCTSLHAFMTAMRNPNSYIYKRKLNIPGYAGHSYYGSVCSSFVAWCYGIMDTLPTTMSFSTYSGMNELPAAQQSADYLKLGDMLNKSGNHIVIITDIYRNRFGEVAYVEVSESTSTGDAVAISRIRHKDYVNNNLIGNGYKIYRYQNIADVPYTASPWVHIDPSDTSIPSYNAHCIPRRGDRANWPKGEDVVLDLIDASAYTGYELTNIETGVTSSGTLSGTYISCSNLANGKYKVRLTGTENSDYTYFNVVETAGTTYEIQSGRKVKVTPHISDGAMTSILFCHNDPNNGLDYMAVAAFHVFIAVLFTIAKIST